MRFTTYSKYHPELADAVNLQGLLDQLGDFLLQSGFAGGAPSLWRRRHGRRGAARWTRCARPSFRRSWIPGSSRPRCSRSCGATSTGDAERDREIEQELSELLDKIVQRLIDEGYLNDRARRRRCPQGYQSMFGPQRPGALRGAAGPVQPDREGYRLPGLQDAQGAARHRRQIELRLARHAVPGHRRRSGGGEQAVRVRRRAESRCARHAHQRDRPRGARRPHQHRVRRPDGEPERVPLVGRDGPDARLLALDDPVRRGPLHAGQEGGARAHPPDPHPVPRRQPQGRALSRFGGGDPAQRTGHGAGGPVPHQHRRRPQARPQDSAGDRRRTCGRSS